MRPTADIRMRTSRSVQDLATVLVINFSTIKCLIRFFTFVVLFLSGQRFALLELKIILSSLIRRFKFEFSSDAELLIPSHQITLKSLTGINLIVSRRCNQ
jgi:hypothetical protein